MLQWVAVLGLVALVVQGGEAPARTTTEEGSGRVISQTRAVSGVTRVEMSAVGKMQVVEGSRESLEVKAEDNVVPILKSEVRRGTLRIWWENPRGKQIQSQEPVEYRLTVKDLSRLTSFSLSGATEVKGTGLDAKTLTLEASGASGFELTVHTKRLKVELSGASGCRLDGEAEEQEAGISGASRYHAAKLQSTTCKLGVSGASEAEVHVEKALTADVSGVSRLRYSGDPSSVSFSQKHGITHVEE